MPAKLETRLAALEARRATQNVTGGRAFALADWRAQVEARRDMTPAERLAVMLRDDLDKWPAHRRADVARVWTQAAELETWFLNGII